MPFKFDADGKIVTQEVNGQQLPVFINASGGEAPFDADATLGNISRLNGEAKSHRERAEKAEGALKAFEGIADPAAAIAALETVKNLNDKKLVDAGEVQKVKDQAIASVRAEYDPIVKERDSLKTALFDEKIGGAFARSKFIGEKVAIPADFVQASFGKHFTVEDGKIVAKDASGNQLFSRTRHGEPADFEEALSILIDGHPQRDSILKGSGASGGGASGGGNGGGSGKRTITRSQFEGMGAAEQAAAARDANVTITD
ncbi:hypothetical protein LV28_24725 [Pandoraea pnomenusa]|uniref:DUF6651 domain-containing protein n=1 Tax=Pandoraea pnomenusa TaxID=93220 RepID=A0A379KD58_9BURK|nr:DUF6651 domain-containing protein [Pandoraea pnomenusa]AIU29348.1 hypothetical protein LV28_24725 [Pandoraea pnomenusa]SUA81997.1 Uncharacterised protein [Pandoraea pnomenusa]SUD65811.1 Uncharacterised protein [Pandoraea pnomenusa]